MLGSTTKSKASFDGLLCFYAHGQPLVQSLRSMPEGSAFAVTPKRKGKMLGFGMLPVLSCLLSPTGVRMSAIMSVRIEDDILARLDDLADATQRSKSFLAAEAIREYLDLNEWQIQHIKEAVELAKDGKFASEQKVAAVFKKWGVDVADQVG